MITSVEAQTWASWFRALGDPTRVRLLHVLASAEEPMKVGALARRVGIAQSTASHHLAQLEAVGFVLLRHDGTTTWCEANRRCFSRFPEASRAIMPTVDRADDEYTVTPSEPKIRSLETCDWTAVREIYAAGIATGNATFEEEAPTWESFDASRLPELRYVAVDDEATVIGWIAASRVSDRCAYSGVIEHSVYVSPDAQGRGVGRRLLEHLICHSEAAGIWTIQSGIFPENTSSRSLHVRCGFREVGIRERMGRHRGRWRDVVMVERRSPTVA